MERDCTQLPEISPGALPQPVQSRGSLTVGQGHTYLQALQVSGKGPMSFLS